MGRAPRWQHLPTSPAQLVLTGPQPLGHPVLQALPSPPQDVPKPREGSGGGCSPVSPSSAAPGPWPHCRGGSQAARGSALGAGPAPGPLRTSFPCGSLSALAHSPCLGSRPPRWPAPVRPAEPGTAGRPPCFSLGAEHASGSASSWSSGSGHCNTTRSKCPSCQRRLESFSQGPQHPTSSLCSGAWACVLGLLGTESNPQCVLPPHAPHAGPVPTRGPVRPAALSTTPSRVLVLWTPSLLTQTGAVGQDSGGAGWPTSLCPAQAALLSPVRAATECSQSRAAGEAGEGCAIPRKVTGAQCACSPRGHCQPGRLTAAAPRPASSRCL